MSAAFEGQGVMITGGARGMGRSHALRFAREGARVAVLDLARDLPGLTYALGSADDLEQTADECRRLSQGRALAVRADVRSAADVASAVQQVVQAFGQIDILVNNAGITTGYCLAHELAEDAWDRALDINLKGVWLCCKHVTPHLIERRRGKIINIASVAGLVASPGYANYVAAKFGVVGLTKTLALELAPHNINVNCICPGTVDTPFTAADMASYGIPPEQTRAAIAQVHPLGRILEPDDITQAVLWLASEAAGNITGIALPVDAGFTIKPPL